MIPFPPLLGYSTNQLSYLENNVMKQMIQHRLSWPFRKPVDAVKLKVPKYYEIIKEPMDLGTIEKKLKSRVYRTAKECIADFNRVFRNCYIFNQPDDEVVATAKDLEKFFLARLAGLPTIEWEVEAQAKDDLEGPKGREASGLQDHLSSYFSAGEEQRRRRSIERLVVGNTSSRSSLTSEEKGQVGLCASLPTSLVDKGLEGSHNGEHAEITETNLSSRNKLKDQGEFKDEKGKRVAPVPRKVVKKMKVDKGKGSGKGKSVVLKVEKKHPRREAGGTVTIEQRGKTIQNLNFKCSGPSASPNKSCQGKGSLDPFISNMMQNLKEVTRSHESMTSSTVEEVLMKHNMNQMKEKLDFIKNCMEEVQKNPQNSHDLKSSVAKLEGALLPGHQHGGMKRRKRAEYSRRPYTDWGEVVAARERNSVDLVKRGEGLQSGKGENCVTPGSSVKRSPPEFEQDAVAEDDISDLLGSDDEGVNEAESQHIVEELVAEILNKFGQSCNSVAQTC